MSRRFGLYLSAQGDPFPSFLGINLARNFSRVFQAHAGYGLSLSGSSSRTVGLGIKAYHPRWLVSPFLGLGYSRILGSDIAYSTPLFGSGYREIPGGTGHVYLSTGVGLQTRAGLFMQCGLNYSLDPRFHGLFFLSVGKFF